MLKHSKKLTGNLLATWCLLVATVCQAQKSNVYFIKFTDKDTSSYSKLLSSKALKRREKFNLAIDYTDFPVNAAYVGTLVSDSSIKLRYTLKWHNAAVVSSDRDLSSLIEKSFITEVKYVGKATPQSNNEKPLFLSPVMMLKDIDMNTQELKPEDYGVSYDQLNQIGVTKLHSKGFNGKGVSIAIFDAGFKNIHTIEAFLKHQANGLLKYGYDLADLDNELNNSDNHGTACASCFGAYDKGYYIGSSPQAHVTLFRTEFAATEYPIEELNWCKAAELADSLGVDMISSSLGYNRYDDSELSYKHEDLDGNTSFIAKSATLAVEKGIVVLNSAGNEGDNKWRKIGTPADAPKVITVGAVDLKGNPGRFTSQGYNANGIVKPDIAACGVLAAVASPNGGYYKGYGTSYATPIAAGGIACLVQAYPNLTPLEIGNLVRMTATKSHQPDSFAGYGVAQIDVAYAYQLAIEQNKKSTELLKYENGQLSLFGLENQLLTYKIFAHKKWLGILPMKKKIQSGTVDAQQRLYRIQLTDKKMSKRTKNYTLKLSYPKSVGIEPLTFSGLSF